MYEDAVDNGLSRIGIMGGTFDPIHYGHLAAAEAARVEFGLSKVIFIPAGSPPHKQSQKISDAEHRYSMTALATSSNSGFEVSRLEVDKAGITYTFNTMKELRSIYGEAPAIYFITGADAVLELLTWYKIGELLTLCKFIAVTRPGFDIRKLEQKIAEITSKYDGEIICLEVPLLEISSTDIRERIRNGKPVKYLLPEEVEAYIHRNGLYKE
ncbi:MAG TPA: nicotinate-nucleotide adenylyltransferase [Bacillota bacterium]|jgi:nicotinate-nucleotide adenylyltransferase|nr:nicotinate-nucleotide adenylyltransferase [Bacillota bacterium]HQE65576.1 nicotinate-nucleotide adenylyltransferase [Bacillota bacterium]HQI16089.1 nicotinate-nucleotide adenylyltransferase [Bacillota bacterium]HQJ38022.1 nicotinate-nucleotide adenylyltransferase [Bacillota bacterium]HRS22051.1 nicotinate-nucleotide adenylyltransferase [Clostridia bacterium]